MKTEIVQFMPRPRHDDAQTDFPVIAFLAVVPGLVPDHAGFPPIEQGKPDSCEP